MGQFDDSVDESIGGTTLEPSPALDPVGQQNVPLPDVSPLVSTMPRLPMPPPPGPPPTNIPMTPAQRLMTLFAASFALGAGPHSGEAMGALNGIAQERQKQQQQAMQQWQYQAGQSQQQAKIVEQQNAELDRQRALKLQTTFENFRKELPKAQSEDDYRKLVEAYSGGLQASGYRVPPEYFYQNFKFTPPTEQQQIQTALDRYYKDKSIAELMKTNPELVDKGAIEYTTTVNGQKVNKRLSINDARKALGIDLNVVNGDPLFSTLGKGTEIQQDTARATAELEAQLGRKLDPRSKSDNNLLMARVGEMQKSRKPEDPLLAEIRQLTLDTRRQQLSQQPTDDDAKSAAQLVINHQMAPSQAVSTYGGFGQAGQAFKRMMVREISKQQPDFNFEQAESEYQLVKSPQFQQNIRYMSSVQESMPRLMASADKLANGNVRTINQALNAGRNAVNDVDLKKFQADVLGVSDEIAKILQGGGTGNGTSDAKLKQAQTILSTSDSPAAIKAALQEMNSLIGFRKKALTRGTYMAEPDVATPTTPSVPAGVTIQRGRGNRG